jgi:hypothetical protein
MSDREKREAKTHLEHERALVLLRLFPSRAFIPGAQVALFVILGQARELRRFDGALPGSLGAVGCTEVRAQSEGQRCGARVAGSFWVNYLSSCTPSQASKPRIHREISSPWAHSASYRNPGIRVLVRCFSELPALMGPTRRDPVGEHCGKSAPGRRTEDSRLQRTHSRLSGFQRRCEWFRGSNASGVVVVAASVAISSRSLSGSWSESSSRGSQSNPKPFFLSFSPRDLRRRGRGPTRVGDQRHVINAVRGIHQEFICMCKNRQGL